MLVDLASATKSNGESPEGLGGNTESDDTGEGGAILGEGIGGAVAWGTLLGIEGAGTDGGGEGAALAVGLGTTGGRGGVLETTLGVGVSPSAESKIAPTLSAVSVLEGSLRMLPILDL